MKFLSSTCFVGRRLLVTGASSGIGRATAVLLAECGAQVTVTGRNAERLAATQAFLPGQGHQAITVNLADADGVAEWLKALAVSEGAFDGIFHASGVVLIKPVRLIKQAHLDEVLGSSLVASFGIARAAGQKGVVNDGASLVFMSSVAATRGQPGMAVYSAAKAGIEGLVRSFACEMAVRKVRVNSVAAGAVETEMLTGVKGQMGEEGVSNYEGRHLLGFGCAQDVACAAAFLLSPAAAWITGTSLVVDGGYRVR